MPSSSFIAIAGNPNSGKTTAFNRYTGSRQQVGNYPGITVEKTEGLTKLDGKEIRLIDLPGTYSLTAYSMEEVVSRRVLMEDKPSAVLDVVNASVLERNLYLTIQLLELGLPIVIAINMIDEAKKQGMSINVQRLQDLLQVQVIPTVARTGEGLEEALRAAVSLSQKTNDTTTRPRKVLEISYGPDIDAILQRLTPYVEEKAFLTNLYPARWVVLKFLEKDEDIIQQGQKSSPEITAFIKEEAAKLEAHLKATLNAPTDGVIAEYRFGYISFLLRQGVLGRIDAMQDRMAYSDKMDTIITHKFFGFIILIGVLYSLYWSTFTLGAYPEEWIASFFSWLGTIAGNFLSEGLLKSLIVSGAIDGVGTVLSFAPLIMVMFLFISIIEDSGYMARIAYMLDRIFRFFGLHGASVMPFIISGGLGGGCAVPGVLATRTLRSPRERLATMLTAPFMSCGAKVPVFLLFANAFFTDHKDLVMVGITLTGWIVALLCALLLRSTVIRGEPTPFVMELPPYRFPTLNGVLIHTWERSWQYIKKAGTIILAIAVLVWAAMVFPGLSPEEEQHFEAMQANYEEQLASLPPGQLSTRIGVLSEQLAELKQEENKNNSVSHTQIQQLEAELKAVQESFLAMPNNALPKEIETLTQEAMLLRTHPDTENMQNIFIGHQEALAKLPPNSPAAQALKKEIARLQNDLQETTYGHLEARIKTLQAELEATQEWQLQKKITDIEAEVSLETLRKSFGGRIGILLEPVTKDAGFDWRTNIALIGGIAAKEVVLSTLGTAYSLGETEQTETVSLEKRIKADPRWNTANAVSLLLFMLLYSPCFVTLAAIKKESNSWKWMFFSFFFNLGIAYIAAVAAYQLLS